MEIKISKDFSYKIPDLAKNSAFLINGENNGLNSILAGQISDTFLPDENFFFDYDEDKNSLDSILQIINTNDFFSTKKSIKIYNINGTSVNFIKSILDYLNRTSNSIVVIFICKDSLDKKIQLYKMFDSDEENLFLINTKNDSDPLIRDIIKQYFPTVESLAENLLVEKLPKDRMFLVEELKKIQLYVKNSPDLSADLINKIVDNSNNYSIFEVIDMIGNKDQRFFNNLRYLFESDSANIIQFLHLLYNHFISLHDIKTNNISGFLYRQQILETQAKKWKEVEIEKMIDIISESEKINMRNGEEFAKSNLLFGILKFF